MITISNEEQSKQTETQSVTGCTAGISQQRPDCTVVSRSLAELGLSAAPAWPLATADIVLAAQLRLRFWRRQLRVGSTQPRTGDPVIDVRFSYAAAAEYSNEAEREQQLAEIRERINTIKSARDCLLHWAQLGLRGIMPYDNPGDAKALNA